jgi:hypothetical protein
MDTPRKRGRPVGSRNRPKPEPEIDLTKPLGLSWTEIVGQAPNPDLPIHVAFKPSFGPAADEWEADDFWPHDWPFPQQGQNIVISDGRGGIVNNVTFDLKNQRIKVRLS